MQEVADEPGQRVESDDAHVQPSLLRVLQKVTHAGPHVPCQDVQGFEPFPMSMDVYERQIEIQREQLDTFVENRLHQSLHLALVPTADTVRQTASHCALRWSETLFEKPRASGSRCLPTSPRSLSEWFVNTVHLHEVNACYCGHGLLGVTSLSFFTSGNKFGSLPPMMTGENTIIFIRTLRKKRLFCNGNILSNNKDILEMSNTNIIVCYVTKN